MKIVFSATIAFTLHGAMGAIAAEGPETLYPSEERRKLSPGHITYYIDPADGSDTNSGVQRKSPWPTFRRINQMLLSPGDRVKVVSPGSFDQTLMLMGAGAEEAPVEVSFAPGRYDFQQNDVLENVTWTPEVEIRGCRVSGIPTRGFLITTRRRVLVEDNEFLNTHMSAILVEDDARGWYESGCVRDMTIRGNRFIRCGEPVIHINPRNTVANDSVHRNTRIENNEFVLRGATSVSATTVRARSTKGLRVTDNTIYSGREAKDGLSWQTSDCADVLIEKNVHLPLSQQ